MTLLEANQTLGVIGCGTMGEAIVRGILGSGNLAAAQIFASDARAEIATALTAKHGIRAGTDNLAVAHACHVALVCVKPYQIAGVLDHEAVRTALAGKLVISIAAGVRLEKLRGYLPGSAVIRAMPNTPALIGEGMAGLARGKGTSDAQMALALALFASVGRAQEVDEAHMDIVTAVAGSGPAFVFVLIDALADGAVRLGLRRDAAVAMAAQMVQGAARMVLQTGAHPAVLKDQVTTPGGCTIAGLGVMEDGKIRSVLARTIEEAARVAGKLG
ncbi:MAG: pyrroline-5-carboxylate reductase [Deltaproteobacteria bacterium]|nr:pyrroline-5-carboxylate reductase [Deltaproteobacteria bacterium]